MIIFVEANRTWNEKTLFKDQDFEALQSFVRHCVNRGIRVPSKHARMVVDFRSRPGQIMVSSYPPVMWKPGMRTMSIDKLDDKQWRVYREQMKRYKEKGGIKIRTQDPITGEIKTETLKDQLKQNLGGGLSQTNSGIIVPT